MKGDMLASARQLACDHASHQSYAQKRFDIINGFELNLTRCINCHKTVTLEVKKFG